MYSRRVPRQGGVAEEGDKGSSLHRRMAWLFKAKASGTRMMLAAGAVRLSLSGLKEGQSSCTCGDHLCSGAFPSRSLSPPKGPEFLEVRDLCGP